MKCLRIDVRSKLPRYVAGELDPRRVKRVEDHLADCGHCRARLVRLRAGQSFARQVPREKPQRDLWQGLEAAIEAEPVAHTPAPHRRALWPRLTAPRLAVALAIIALLIAAAVFAFRQSRGEAEVPVLAADVVDLSSFHPVSISGIESNTEPHVMAEGYVSEVRIDHEDGDLMFKLVDDVRQPGPFIVCEIINPKRIAPPAVGSRVRVYGVSRYDAKADHQWYEVHPVLDIEVVKK